VRIADRSDDPQTGRDAWTFSTIDAAIDAVLYQVGFGWLPEERIRSRLEQGVLKILPLSHGARRATPLHLIVKRDLALDKQLERCWRCSGRHESPACSGLRAHESFRLSRPG
jgi:DNA-binding transcriptional LysR family regulator